MGNGLLIMGIRSKPAPNLSRELETLCRTYRMLLANGNIQRADLVTKVIAAQAVVTLLLPA